MDNWRHIEYLQQGISHVQDKSECQDRFCIRENEECLVAALADGLGSLKYSEIASSVATETVCSFFETVKSPLQLYKTKNEMSKAILDKVVYDIQVKAGELEIPLKELDCTLIFVCILKTEGKVLIGRLGDSVVCVIAESECFAVNDGNRTANGTNAILDKNALEHFNISLYDLTRDNIYGFILSSDGLENELYMKGSGHVNKSAEIYFNAWFQDQAPEAVIKSRIADLTGFEGTPFDDDISIVVLSRAKKYIKLPEDPTWLCTCGCRNNLQSTYCIKCNRDFAVLYRNIKFKEYGGKAAFFSKINQNPEEERKIIGLISPNAAKPESDADKNVINTIDVKKRENKENIPAQPENKSVIDPNQKAPHENMSLGITPVLSPNSVPQEGAVIESQNVPLKIHEQSTAAKPVVYTAAAQPKRADNAVPAPAGGMASESGRYAGTADADNNRPGSADHPNQSVSNGKPVNQPNQNRRVFPGASAAKSPENNAAFSRPNVFSTRRKEKNGQRKWDDRAFKVVCVFAIAALILGLIFGCWITKAVMSHKISKMDSEIEPTETVNEEYKEVAIADEPSDEEQSPDTVTGPSGVINNRDYAGEGPDSARLPRDTSTRTVEDESSDIAVENEEPQPAGFNGDMPKEGETENDGLNSYEIQASSADLREEPGTTSEPICTLPQGTVVSLVDNKIVSIDGNPWIHVKTESGAEGWISQRDVSIYINNR